MTGRVTPRIVRFVCQLCGEWASYQKVNAGVDRYLCDQCVVDSRHMYQRYRYRQQHPRPDLTSI